MGELYAEVDGDEIVLRMPRDEANALLRSCITAEITGDFIDCRDHLLDIYIALIGVLLPVEAD